MTAANRILLLRPGEGVSAKGDTYLSGWLGEASVVAFQAEEPDVRGNPVRELFVSTPESGPETRQERAPARPADGEGEVRSRAGPTARGPAAVPADKYARDGAGGPPRECGSGRRLLVHRCRAR